MRPSQVVAFSGDISSNAMNIASAIHVWRRRKNIDVSELASALNPSMHPSHVLGMRSYVGLAVALAALMVGYFAKRWN